MTDKKLQELFTNAIIQKTDKNPDWHRPVAKKLYQEVCAVFNRWQSVGSEQHSISDETTALMKELETSIFESILQFQTNLKNDDKDNWE